MSEQIENNVVKKKNKKGLFILLAIVVVILGIILVNKVSDFADSKKEGVTLNISEYFSNFDSNERLAEKKYIGNRYTITGKITRIEPYNSTTEVYVEVAEFSRRLNFQECFRFRPYDENVILDLKVGQYITATGTLIELPGYGGGVLENSVFETK